MMDKLLDIAGVGGTVVLVLLLGLSVISIGIILERLLYFRRNRIDAVELASHVLARLAAGDRDAVTQRLRSLRGVEAAALLDAMAWYDAGPEAFTEILQKGLTQRRKEFESGLVFLGTLGNNAPFVGLFGTVLGIIRAFHDLAGSALQGQGTQAVMTGIAEALVATGVGLLVALPSVAMYNILVRHVETTVAGAEAMSREVIAYIKTPAATGASGKEAA